MNDRRMGRSRAPAVPPRYDRDYAIMLEMQRQRSGWSATSPP
jgi:hypothetical protein